MFSSVELRVQCCFTAAQSNEIEHPLVSVIGSVRFVDWFESKVRHISVARNASIEIWVGGCEIQCEHWRGSPKSPRILTQQRREGAYVGLLLQAVKRLIVIESERGEAILKCRKCIGIRDPHGTPIVGLEDDDTSIRLEAKICDQGLSSLFDYVHRLPLKLEFTFFGEKFVKAGKNSRPRSLVLLRREVAVIETDDLSLAPAKIRFSLFQG